MESNNQVHLAQQKQVSQKSFAQYLPSFLIHKTTNSINIDNPDDFSNDTQQIQRDKPIEVDHCEEISNELSNLKKQIISTFNKIQDKRNALKTEYIAVYEKVYQNLQELNNKHLNRIKENDMKLS